MRPPDPVSAAAARRTACGQAASTSPPSSRTSGVSRRSELRYGIANRPLSQFHSELIAGSSHASRRMTVERRTSVRREQPLAQCSHTVGVETRSNGRARKR